jgi:hypothetical protein
MHHRYFIDEFIELLKALLNELMRRCIDLSIKLTEKGDVLIRSCCSAYAPLETEIQ